MTQLMTNMMSDEDMKAIREQVEAATKIQAAHRGRAARRRVATLRGGEEEPPPPLDKEDSLGAVGATP